MLYIDYIDAGGSKRSATWKLGDIFPSPDLPKNHKLQITVEANGEEFTYIVDRFKNLPYDRLNSKGVWQGEFARFIVENLAL